MLLAGSDAVWAPAGHVVRVTVTEGITGQHMCCCVCQQRYTLLELDLLEV